MKANLVCSDGVFCFDNDNLVFLRNMINHVERNSIMVSRAGLAIRRELETYDFGEEDEDELYDPLVFIDTIECIIKESSSELSLDSDVEPYE